MINDTGNDIGVVTVHRKAGEGYGALVQGSDGIERQWKIETSVPFSGTRNISVSWIGENDNGNILQLLKAWKYTETKSGWEAIPGAVFNTSFDPRTCTFTIDGAESYTMASGSYFAGGKGTYEEPWLIRTAQNLDSIRYFSGQAFTDCHFAQTAEIDLGTSPWNSGNGWIPLSTLQESPFKGNYEGNGYSIKNLTIANSSLSYASLFGRVESAELRNIKMSGADVEGFYYCGILAGYCDSVFVENCSVAGTVMANGGYAGGLSGYTNWSYLLKSSSSSDISSWNNYVGGLSGSMSGYSSVTECFSSGTVTGNNYVGGISGYDNYSSYDNCYSTSGVTSYDHYSGGFIGYTYSSSVNKSYSCGSVNGYADAGGFVGFDFYDPENFSIFTNCYWDTQASGQIVSAAGEARTTDDMTYPFDPNTFIFWDFSISPVWIGNSNFNNGYPYLAWENRDYPLAPFGVTMSFNSGNLTLSWNAVEGATGYAVYSSADPYGSFSIDETGTFNGEEWTAPLPAAKMFYYVTALNNSKKLLKADIPVDARSMSR
jgi:hypothetical protein